jgi:hypothetical protein
MANFAFLDRSGADEALKVLHLLTLFLHGKEYYCHHFRHGLPD